MSDHWHTIGMVILIALCALLINVLAVRGQTLDETFEMMARRLAEMQLALEPHDHAGASGEFYSKWQRPKGNFSGMMHRGASCCNRTDCSPVIATEMRDGRMFARFELDPNVWYRVDPSIIESNQEDPRESPDHRAHGCIIGGQVACFVHGSGS